MSKRAAIYCRVSTDDQRSNYSIPTQLAACLAYAAAKGYAVVGDQYVDPDTGYDTRAQANAKSAYVDDFTSRELSRPSLDAALLYLERTGFDVLIVHALDRLARDPYIRQTLELEFSRRGAKVEYVLGAYEDSPEGEVRKDLDATFGKWETAKRVERCNRGKIGKATKGLFVTGRAPYGYRIDPTALGGLAVDETEAATVRHVFDAYLKGESIRGIARLLTEEGAIPSDGGDWQRSSVARMLRNTVYAGKGYYNKHKRSGRRLAARDTVQWIEYQTTPLVAAEVFEEVQRRLKHNKSTRRCPATRFYLLSGMIFCTECERPYVAQTAKAGRNRRVTEARSYRHRMTEGHCLNRQMSASILEPKVWAAIEGMLLDPTNLRRGYEDSLAQQQAARARQRNHLDTLRQRLSKIEQTRQNLSAAYIDPEINMRKADYIAQKTRLEAEANEVSSTIAETEKELANLPTLYNLEAIETFSAQVKESLTTGELTPEDKRRICEFLHIKLMVDAEGDLRLEGWFSPSVSLSSITYSCDRQLPVRFCIDLRFMSVNV